MRIMTMVTHLRKQFEKSKGTKRKKCSTYEETFCIISGPRSNGLNHGGQNYFQTEKQLKPMKTLRDVAIFRNKNISY